MSSDRRDSLSTRFFSNGIASVTAELSTLITNILPSFNRRRSIPTFSGLKHENPDKFIEALVEHFVARNTPTRERIPIAVQMLKGEAEVKLARLKRHGISWEEFADEVKEKYGSPMIVAELRRSLFDDEQQDGEGVEEFLREKRALAGRLHPELDEERLVAMMMLLLKRDIRQFLEDRELKTVSRLIQRARSVERNMDRYKSRRNKDASPSTAKENPLITEAQLRRQLFAEHQKDEEGVEEFLRSKLNLAYELNINIPDEEIAASLLPLISIKIGRYFCHSPPKTCLALISIAKNLEKNVMKNGAGAVSSPIPTPKVVHKDRKPMPIPKHNFHHRKYLTD